MSSERTILHLSCPTALGQQDLACLRLACGHRTLFETEFDKLGRAVGVTLIVANPQRILLDFKIYEYDVTVGSGTGTAWALAARPASIDPNMSPCFAVQAAPTKENNKAADLMPNAERAIFRNSAAWSCSRWLRSS